PPTFGPGGVPAGGVVVLDGSAKLPVVDGSQLTNLQISSLEGKPVSPATPSGGQVLTFDGTTWGPASVSTGGAGTIIASAPLIYNASTGALTINQASGSASGF